MAEQSFVLVDDMDSVEWMPMQESGQQIMAAVKSYLGNKYMYIFA